MRIRVSTHEDIERPISSFRPCVNRNMALSENSNAANALRREAVEMQMQQGRAALLNAIAERAFNPTRIIQAIAAYDFDDKMRSGKDLPITADEMVVVSISRQVLSLKGCVLRVVVAFGCFRFPTRLIDSVDLRAPTQHTFRLGGA